MIEFCTCPEGPYHGAQQVGTVPVCEQCRRLPNEPWVVEWLTQLLVEAEVLTPEVAEADYKGRTYADRVRYVTSWRTVGH